MTRKKVLLLSACFLVLALPILAATYQFKSINPFHSVETSARGIDNHGNVVGDFATAAQQTACTESGFVLHDGAFKKINVPFAGATDTDANGVNNDGDVVGNWDVRPVGCSNGGVDHGYVLSEGKFIMLPDPPNQTGGPDFNAINDEDDVVGVLTPVPPTPKNGNRGFLLDDGVYTLIDCGKDQTEANGINDDGDIVGECTDFSPPAYHEHGFLLRDGTFYLIDYPGAGCDGTVAYGINANGDIAGTYSDANCNEHGFVVKDFPEEPKWQTVDVPGAANTKVAAINDNDGLAGTISDATDNINLGFKATTK